MINLDKKDLELIKELLSQKIEYFNQATYLSFNQKRTNLEILRKLKKKIEDLLNIEDLVT